MGHCKTWAMMGQENIAKTNKFEIITLGSLIEKIKLFL